MLRIYPRRAAWGRVDPPGAPPRTFLPLLVVALTAGAAVFFAGSAVAPALAEAWGLDASEGASLSWAVQAGFIAGTLLTAGLNLADRYPPARLLAAMLVGAAAANAAMLLVDGNLGAAVALRFVTGMIAGPIYPIGMKLVATWYARAGWQLGVLLAFNTLGFGAGFLLRAANVPWPQTLLAASALALVGALVALTLRAGPLLPPRSPFDPRAAARAFREREYRRSAFAYFGHMWELFAFWALLPFWLAATGLAPGHVALLAGGSFVAGAVGCLAAGAWSRRVGEARAAAVALAVSGALCLLSPLLFGAPAWLLAPAVLLWGAAVIADSAMYSAISARSAPRGYVGTALTTQNMLGFGVTIVSIALVAAFAEAVASWRYALLLLAPGPLLGLLPLARLMRAT